MKGTDCDGSFGCLSIDLTCSFGTMTMGTELDDDAIDIRIFLSVSCDCMYTFYSSSSILLLPLSECLINLICYQLTDLN